MNELAAHTILACVVVVAYTLLTALGHDGNALIGVLAGQGAGAGISKLSKR